MRVFQQAPFEAVENNKGFCGNITGLKDCPRTHNENTKYNQGLMILILVPTICLVLILIMIVGILIFLRRTKKKETEPPKPVNHPPFAIWSYDGKMMYETIIDAVDDFDSKHVIEVGGCGTVYRAELPTGESVAIKKFNTQEPDEWVDFKSFENEVRALTGTRRHNIVKLYGFCAHPRHAFLVYEFIDGGSLRNLLNDAEKMKELDWCKRANVIKGVADALSYLHHDCLEPIVHRDLSSSNVFFGIVTLEVMMGKHSGDLISLTSRSNVKELANYVILDQRNQPPSDHMAEVVKFCVELALMCVNANPSTRPSMRQVSIELSNIITS
ncbi:putative protein kinase RLK-Pelle-LRR-XI-1 family [Helianthus annuus]|uniref:non-specific serine/threonine protein kinase n=1 Tax=Helianthus annuus TaxID=4232 RepID=A0A9K3NP74_HELAN|nr:putative protein kinase RLK-Pelle-LRR-XI-1 family [Helianthus annuus]KAJ0571771.1 putative protein kinase RLK-Pelle-LRR-XI-1 family [Helianthus annuus]KAJ0586146.1 putative protein kinase RLK-Pelle-LRR-XI-1 family [Helianthus annuus]